MKKAQSVEALTGRSRAVQAIDVGMLLDLIDAKATRATDSSPASLAVGCGDGLRR